jgi:leucyl/phenylalanyl-tRNA--protein transferase
MSKDDPARKGHTFVHRVLDFGQRRFLRALAHAAAIVPGGPVRGVCALAERFPLTPEHILLGYAQGMFPMDQSGHIRWHCPDPRHAIPLERLHIPSRAGQYLRRGHFELEFDRDPAGVLAACGDRKRTWLTPRLQAAYRALFDLGAMHTAEARQGDRLVGGAFGVALGTVFTVESMFSHEDHAGKLVFAHLCQHLVTRGFTLVDCQYPQEHTERFGAIEMPREEYRDRLARGLIHPPSFMAPTASPQAEGSGG